MHDKTHEGLSVNLLAGFVSINTAGQNAVHGEHIMQQGYVVTTYVMPFHLNACMVKVQHSVPLHACMVKVQHSVP